MVTIYLCGGLGNQMFQYAFAKFLESKGFEVGFWRRHIFSQNPKGHLLKQMLLLESGGGGARYA